MVVYLFRYSSLALFGYLDIFEPLILLTIPDWIRLSYFLIAMHWWSLDVLLATVFKLDIGYT